VTIPVVIERTGPKHTRLGAADGRSQHGLAPIIAKTKAELVEEVLRERLIAGQYEAGSRLRIDALAKDLGVSHTPIKEALRRLSSTGFIEYHAHKGMRVREFSAHDGEEVYRLSILAEGHAIERAASRLSPMQFRQLHRLQDKMMSELRRERFEQVSQLNSEFHSLIYSAADSPRLLAWIDGLRAAFPRAIDWDHQERPLASIPEHVAILAALEAKDGARAKALLASHIEAALHFILQQLASRDASVSRIP
jgi:DNA-binding GntR family transcriptional regulator